MSKDLPPSRKADQFVVRLPDGMRDRISDAAEVENRSMNSEIVARLQSSFEPTAAALPTLVQHAITDEMKARGGTAEDALIRLALVAQAKGGTIFYAKLTSKTKFHEFMAMLEAGKTIIPPDASIQFEITPED